MGSCTLAETKLVLGTNESPYQVVMLLLKPCPNKVRNVTTENYFTSKLAILLQKSKTSVLGTINKIRKEVIAEVKHMKEPFYYTHVTNMVMHHEKMTVCQCKAINCGGSQHPHPSITVADNARINPECGEAYSDTKYGVDIVDRTAKKYTIRTSTRRWPMHSFHNTQHLVAINTSIIYKEVTKNNITRRVFLQKLADGAKWSTQTTCTKFIKNRRLHHLSSFSQHCICMSRLINEACDVVLCFFNVCVNPCIVRTVFWTSLSCLAFPTMTSLHGHSELQ